MIPVAVSLLLAVGLLASCGIEDPSVASPTVPGQVVSPTSSPLAPASPSGASTGPSTGASSSASEGPSAPPLPGQLGTTVPDPGPLRDSLLGADLMLVAKETIPERVIRRAQGVSGVSAVERLSLGQVAVEDRVISVAAVEPGSYRRFTPLASARLDEAWTRVAAGELAINPRLGRRLTNSAGYLTLGNDEAAPDVHVGALTEQMPQVDAVVNEPWGERLGIPSDNAAVVFTGLSAPQVVRPRLERLLKQAGVDAAVLILGPDLDVTAPQTAVLTGGDVAAAVGSFTYFILDGGRISPDAAWVRKNIRTEWVPILGKVTCHRALFPQLRAALTEVKQRGLADEIHPDEYAGCYYPRFIANTTQLSLHSFGIALDINVPGNLRGTRGEISRDVVSIFKQWGFGWGGDWRYTDPMHFEMNALVSPG